MITRYATILALLFALSTFGQNKKCFCDKDTLMNNNTMSCDTTIFSNNTKMYWQFNCDRIWLTFENVKKEKIVLNEVSVAVFNLTYRLGYRLIKENNSSLLFQSGCLANGPCVYTFIDKNTGEVLRISDTDSTTCGFATGKAELILNIIDSRRPERSTYLSELIVLKNGVRFKTLNPAYEEKQILNGLECGTYTLIYQSLFDKEVRIVVEITERKMYSTTIYTNYIDYSQEAYKPIVSRLKENESYVVYMESQGCFHASSDTFTIKRNNDVYNIIWGTKTKVLTPVDLEAIKHFEIELHYMRREGCTTSVSYTIKYNRESIFVVDGTCRWSGADYLKKQLFGADK